MHRSISSTIAVLAVAVPLLMGQNCNAPFLSQVQNGCQSNVQCGPFKQCDVPTGRCLCTDNRGCGEGEFCNAALQCQAVSGCSDNTDCETQGLDLICNVLTGQCSPRAVCVLDSQCPLGRICESGTGACIEACRDEGDCPLGAGCIRDGAAPLGTCQLGACSRTADCPAAQVCDLTVNRCVRDERGPFCGACQFFDPLDPQCGERSNYCLIDTGDPAGEAHFCGVDCSQQQGCPSGYTCSDVIIVGPPATPQCGVEICANNRCSQTGAACTRNEDCPIGPPGGDCMRARVGICAGTQDQECMSDMDCGGSEGSCRKATCGGGENSAFGFCSCVIDADCPADNCRDADLSDPANPEAGYCFISGRRCFTDDDCNVIACVNGGCLIGQNCAPDGDRRCQDLE